MNRKSWVGGIYRIINKVNNKSYIGSTVNFYNRRKTHFSKLRLNYSGNKNLQNDFNIYKKSDFEFEILEGLEDLNKLNLYKKEQHYIDLLKPEYNVSKIAGSNKGYKMSEKTVEGRTKKQSINILQFDLEGNFIKEWQSSRIAGKELNISPCHIRECCRGVKHRNTAKGFIWKNKS